MESRRQHLARTQNVKKKTKAESFASTPAFTHIAELIEDGEITIGTLRPIGCVATVSDDDPAKSVEHIAHLARCHVVRSSPLSCPSA